MKSMTEIGKHAGPPPSELDIAAFESESVNDEFLVIENWCTTTDKGSDIDGARLQAAKIFSSEKTKFWWDVDCFSHQYQIMSGNAGWAMEEYFMPVFGPEYKGNKFYSATASVLHVIRDNQATMFCHWVADHGLRDAKTHRVHCIAPKPITGRWGRRSQCQEYLIDLCGGDYKRCADMFERSVKGRSYFIEAADADCDDIGGADGADADAVAAAGGKGKDRKRKRGDIDDTHQDEQHARKTNFGKWSRRGLKTIVDPRWWIGVKVSQRIQSKLDRLLWTVDKYTRQDKTHLEVTDERDRELENLAWLVYGKADAVYCGIEELLDSSVWDDILALALETLPPCDQTTKALEAMPDAIRRLVLRQLADYRRRIQDIVMLLVVASGSREFLNYLLSISCCH